MTSNYERTNYARASHAHLILRLHNKRIGIWNLEKDKWHRRPFTRSREDAGYYLRAERMRLTLPRPSLWERLRSLLPWG